METLSLWKQYTIGMKKKYQLTASLLLLACMVTLDAKIPNGGLEEWVQDGDDYNPVDWQTTNNAPFLNVSPYTPAYEGNFSMKVSTFDAGVMVVAGVATMEFSYSKKPAALNACLKTTIMPGDRVLLIFSMFHKDSIIALPTDCTFSIDSTISDFSCFSFPITYRADLDPDSAIIIIMAGSAAPQVGTEIVVDALSFQDSNPTSQALFLETGSVGNYPNPAGRNTFIPVNLLTDSDVEILVWDSKGALVQSIPYHSLRAGKHTLEVDTGGLPQGVYPYAVRAKGVTLHGKMIINQ